MQLSAEIRWFWPEGQAPGLHEWFVPGRGHGGVVAGGGTSRVDVYLHDGHQSELGLKRRGDKPGVEVKGLVADDPVGLAGRCLRGPIQVWCKWTSEPLVLPDEATVALEKTRWLRKFAGTTSGLDEVALGADEKPKSGGPMPDRGCNVEVTRVVFLRPEGGAWWTLGLESFGAHETVRDDLRRAAELLDRRGCPESTSGTCASYPAWLTAALAARS